MTRLKVIAIAGAVALVILFVMLPPGTQQTALPPASTVRGAFHVHSNRSDGSGSVEEIAAAAARAGLQFIVLTDHGDGTRTPDPPAYRSGVLVIDAVELSTTGGHYAAIGLPASPYPLAGAAAEVIEDVHRLGGFGFAAHSGSPRPSLSWQDWQASIDGLEWINADSEWRDEARLPIARAIATYLLRGPQSMATLLDRPEAVLQKWDELSQRRKLVGLAGADAHARLGLRQGGDPDYSSVHLPLPSYEASFRVFSNHVVLDAPLSHDAQADAARVIGAIRSGHVYSVIDALATPGSLSFTATSGSQSARMGDDLAIEGDVSLKVSAQVPPGTTLVLLRNGRRVHEAAGAELATNGGREPAVYRVEAYTAGAPGEPAVPWIVSNPIYAGYVRSAAGADAPAPPLGRIPARITEAAPEFGANDSSAVQVGALVDPGTRTFTGDPALTWAFTLSPGQARGQFAAVALPVSGGLAAFDRVRFLVSAASPMRVWVQLRAPVGNTERWGSTFYADSEPRIVDLPFSAFRAIGVTSQPLAPLDRVDSLLFVVDTLNALPGKSGTLTISEVAFVK